MTDSYQWRRRFIDLVEDVFRDLGFPPPAMTHDPNTPLAMEIEVEGISFEVVHTPDQRPDHLLIECNFGHPPDERLAPALKRLMEVNLIMAREHQASFGADPKTNAVIFTSSEKIEESSARKLMDEMRALAERAKEWRDTLYLDAREANDAGFHQALA